MLTHKLIIGFVSSYVHKHLIVLLGIHRHQDVSAFVPPFLTFMPKPLLSHALPLVPLVPMLIQTPDNAWPHAQPLTSNMSTLTYVYQHVHQMVMYHYTVTPPQVFVKVRVLIVNTAMIP